MDDEELEDKRTRGKRVGDLYNKVAILLNQEGCSSTEAIAATGMLFIAAWTDGVFGDIEDPEDLLEYLYSVSELMAEANWAESEEPEFEFTGLWGNTEPGEA